MRDSYPSARLRQRFTHSCKSTCRSDAQSAADSSGDTRLLDDIKQLGVPSAICAAVQRFAIALAPSGDDNGFLTAGEILEDLKLNAELVVLSACSSGQG